ncbi:biopolymer transport protein ExbD [Devosia sp. UYZn731]|uniref:biopolymer transporter ExbD n=1 Tax=Devosia sp. UYZn731 TaxID=3156345 RepID=UPI00339893CD
MAIRLGGQSKRRFSFMLTPLVDVMFLLLLFFMLSSQTAPYGLLAVSGQTATATSATTPLGVQRELVVSVGSASARFNGKLFARDQLGTAVAQAIADGYTTAYVSAARQATAQDLVDVIDTFKGAGFPSVLIVPASGRGN